MNVVNDMLKVTIFSDVSRAKGFIKRLPVRAFFLLKYIVYAVPSFCMKRVIVVCDFLEEKMEVIWHKTVRTDGNQCTGTAHGYDLLSRFRERLLRCSVLVELARYKNLQETFRIVFALEHDPFLDASVVAMEPLVKLKGDRTLRHESSIPSRRRLMLM